METFKILDHKELSIDLSTTGLNNMLSCIFSPSSFHIFVGEADNLDQNRNARIFVVNYQSGQITGKKYLQLIERRNKNPEQSERKCSGYSRIEW